MEKKDRGLRLLFWGYAGVMLWLLLGREPAGTGGDYWEAVRQNLNLEPLRTLQGYWSHLARHEYYRDWFGADYPFHAWQAIRNLVGNVVLFVPLGYFLPRLWPGLGRWWRTWAVSALLVTGVELVQLLSLRGSGDVDDLLLNLAGAALGYGIFWLRNRRNPVET